MTMILACTIGALGWAIVIRLLGETARLRRELDGLRPESARANHLAWSGAEWVDDRCGCRYHPDDDSGSHGGAPHVHRCERHGMKS